MNTLNIQLLSKAYANGVQALHDVSLNITNGMFGLLGPNGAGKSTLMKTIVGLQKPTSGTIHFNEQDIIAHPEIAKRQLGYLPQDFGVYKGISAMDLLDHLAILKGIPTKSARKEQIEALLEQTNLYDHRNRAVSGYSGGMRQRFGIAQALLGSPQLIVVDEPTAGLDPEERNRFNNLLSEIGEQIIVILSTHIVEDVRNLCTRMAIIKGGQILAQGAPEDFVMALQGTIWRRKIQRAELTEINAAYQVLSSQLNGGQLSIHVHANSQPEGFEPKSVDLEDVYFYQLQNASPC
jgi:ABC-type multidrug transport system ATPase subunit